MEEDKWGMGVDGWHGEEWTNPGAPPGFCSSLMKSHLIMKLKVDFVTYLRLYGGPEGQIQQIQAVLCLFVCEFNLNKRNIKNIFLIKVNENK